MNFRIKVSAVICIALGLSSQSFSQKITLEQVIKEVCTNSDSVKMMQETIIKSQEMIREKRAAAFPTVSTSATTARQYTPMFSSSKEAKGFSSMIKLDAKGSPYYDQSIQIQQPIYTFGKIGTAIKVASQFDKATQCSYKRNLQQLQMKALDAFYAVILSEMALDISKRSINRQKELSEFLNRNFQLGSGSKAQILATQAEMKGQLIEVIKAEEHVRISKMLLNYMMGRCLADTFELDTTSVLPDLLAKKLLSKKDAVEFSLTNRTDLRALDFLAEANRGGSKILRSNYFPIIAGIASFGTNGYEPGQLIDKDNRNWKVGINVSWTIFDGFQSSALAAQYQSDSRKTQIARNTMSKMVEIEVDSALVECTAADNNKLVSEEQLAAAQESYDLTNENFKQGSGQFSELQLAEERLHQSEMSGMNARYRQVRSRAALMITMGQNIVKLEE